MPDNQTAVMGQLKVLQAVNKYEFAVEIRVIRSGVNNNKWNYQNIDKYYQTFCGKPILCAYVGQQIGDGHNMKMVIDPKTGEKRPSFMDPTAERIVGTISDDPADLRLEEENGETWIVAKGRLWSFYAPELVEKIVRTGRMDVSAETDVKPGPMDGDVEIFNEWSGLGVTILGDHVDPAVPGANIAALAAMQNEFRELKLRAASLRTNQQPRDKKKNRGVNNRMSKRVLDRLAPKFEGYHLLASTADGNSVVMVDARGNGYSYTFDEADHGEVIPSRIQEIGLCVNATIGEESVSLDMGVILDHVASCATKADNDLTAQVKTLSSDLEKANATIEAYKTAEHDRRVQSVKDTITKTLADINATAAEGVESVDDVATKLNADIEHYACQEDGEGKFCGAEMVRSALLAAAQEKHMAHQKMLSAKKQGQYAWNSSMTQGDGSEGGIDAMLAHFDI